jgi:hypothetical protein
MTAPPANESGGGCCVPGCDSDAFHTQTFTIAVGGWGGEIETSSHFCCAHFDRLLTEKEPFLDLTVIGVERV